MKHIKKLKCSDVFVLASNLASQRSFLFSGTKDTTVNPEVMSVLNDYFNNYATDSDQVVFKNDLVAAHTQPTDDSVSATQPFYYTLFSFSFVFNTLNYFKTPTKTSAFKI